jgi:5,5'-dehydrodivanillate O-demethylase
LRSQGVLPDRTQNRLGQSDSAIILLRKLYARELTAIERDEPLTKFPIPDVARLLRLNGDKTTTAALDRR